MRRAQLLLLPLAAAGLMGLLWWQSSVEPAPELARGISRGAYTPPDSSQLDSQCSVRPIKLPDGKPSRLSCRDARRVISEVRGRLAAPGAAIDHKAFADSVSGWLDPHGLWSAAPDAPSKRVIGLRAKELILDLERSPRDGVGCGAAREVAQSTRAWVGELGKVYRSAHASAKDASTAFALAADAVYEDDPVTRPARHLAADLGRRAVGFERFFGDAAGASVAARDRLFPELSLDGWTEVVLASAVRAYVPLVDPHGQWAPMDEEWSLYAADSALDVGPRLWGRMLRTALGVRVLEDATPPLEDGDLVLSVGGIATAGLSVEQVEQLSRLEPAGGEIIRDVVVLRAGDSKPRTVRVPIEEGAVDGDGSPFAVERVPFNDGEVAVIAIADVPDGLGDALGRTVEELNAERPKPVGLVLDLRGNGGGSLDGATSAVGVFLPGASCFPLTRRSGAVEVQRAPTPKASARWTGPVAALVDGYTASAAEILAGALTSYDRGPVIGARTFGKGCIQEYFDDRAGVGVLRLTTMLFALPDGQALQGVGIEPDLSLPIAAPREREKQIAVALPAWRGPDVRSGSTPGPAWPRSGPRVGPCSDAMLCRALRRLGAAPPHAHRRTASAPRR